MDSDNQMDKVIKELTLLLLYLCSWEEKEEYLPAPIRRSWKGYLFEVLNELAEDGYILQGKRPSRSKSVTLTDEGVAKAEELKRKYLEAELSDNT